MREGEKRDARFADAEASGCGVQGGEVLLWTFAQNKILYSRDWLAWPGNGATTNFDTSFSLSAAQGGAPRFSEFVGEVYDRGGDRLPPGTRVQAFVGEVLCGVASVRRTGNFSGYILDVVGPDSMAGCDDSATLTFSIDGQPAIETGVNNPGHSGGPPSDLTVQ